MALHFHKIPISNSTTTLKNLVSRYTEYTKKVVYPTIDEENYEMCKETTSLLQSGINQLKEGKEDLIKLYNEIREEYKNCKNKSDKKDLMAEIEQIENESQLHKELASAAELIFMLTARLDESKCLRDKMSVKLGYISQRALIIQNTPSENQDHQIDQDQNPIQIETTQNCESNHSQATTDSAAAETVENNVRPHRSIKPPQATLPKFYGNAEEFQEYWAIFETLVHKSQELDVMEKILLLKESLKGRAQASIKGIALVPQNYEWIIQTLKEKYCNQPTNRAQVVQKLVNLKPASDFADSCSAVFDQIQILINQMVSAGYDVRKTSDPMWCETILAKFPHDIVKPVLLSNQMQDRQTIENLTGHLKKEIAAKGYVENRLGHKQNIKVITPKDKYVNSRTYSNDQCLFCQKGNHASLTCRTITDQGNRRKILTDGRRCWKCCSSNHSSFDCQKPDCPKCGQKHHASLCFKKEGVQNRNQAPWNNNTRSTAGQNNSRSGRFQREQGNFANQGETRRMNANNIQMCAKTTLASSEKSSAPSQLVLMTAEGNVWNHNKGEYEKILFFFDSGAQRTVIEESLADSLGMPKQTSEICTMSGIGGHIECFKSHIVNVKISTVYGEELELKIQTKPVITNGFPSVNLSSADVAFLKANSICLSNSKLRGERQKPHILVGLDHYHELVTGPINAIQTPTGLHIAKTVFGPTIYGKGVLQADSINATMCYGMTSIQEKTEQEILQKMFELDGLGISPEECQKSEKTLEYLAQYSKKVSFSGGFITAPFPLKDNISQLEDNYCVAIRRLESLQIALQKNPEQCRWYTEILNKYQKEGMIETFSTQCEDSAGVYYMPHSGVWKSSKKVPLRIVFDASSKKRGKLSLNDVIEKGESFINKIHDILLTSRASKIVLMCDIEAAFTQVRLVDYHKDLCRFLWLKNINHPPTKDNLIYYRFRRLPFGVTASPSILNMALTTYLNDQNTELAKEISQNLYVDNILMQAESIGEALRKYRESKSMFAKIGMNLREYISNSTGVNDSIPAEDKLEFGLTKLLGVRYNTEMDSFNLSTRFPPMSAITKKDIVSQINSVYDPIGLAGPLLVRLKSMMREIFELKSDWKTILAPHICERWNQLTSEVNNAYISVPRTLPNNLSSDKKRLWVFADASNAAIAACAYLQGQTTNLVSPLICGKTKLTPKKTRQTIPRLELVGILMAVRLSQSILSAMNTQIEQISIVSDSEIALYWLKTSKKVPLFVSNQRDRILKIKDQIQANGVSLSFLHVITCHNPADAGTRGLSAQKISNHDWLRGPRWLEKSAETWPLRPMDAIEEVSDEQDNLCSDSLVNIQANIEDKGHEKIIDLSRFSQLNKVLRTLSIIGKTIQNWVNKTNRNKGTVIRLEKLSEYETDTEISAQDIELSERILITQEQKNVNIAELQKRYHDKKVIRDHNGIIRHESRLQNAVIPYDTKSPMFIPEQSELVRLIINKVHLENAHCGKDHTLSVIQQRFWIPRAAATVRKWVSSCTTCKRYQGLPLGAPSMPPLPKDRVISKKAFENVGCDYMGPFTSKTQEKMYVCLYTCLTTRAVHLEVVENLSTGSFLNSFVRFISRRGVPKLVRSDCGTNFKHGEQIIAAMFEKDDTTGNSLMSYCANKKTKWLFNPPGAPWMGGAWERLVGSVKKALNKSIGRKRLSFTEMYTVLTRIEAILNTRPLTKPNSDDLSRLPLRPIDFLQGNLKFSLPQGENIDSNDLDYNPECIQSEKQALEAFRFSEEIASKFWECWKTEYLVSLREIQKIHLRQPRHLKRTCPEIGEIVLIEQDLIPRGSWPYGKITDLITSTDGLTRSAKVLMPNHRTIHRPLNKLFPLEIRCVTEQSAPQQAPAGQNPEQPNMRPILQRKTKTAAYDIIRNFENDLESSQQSSSMKIPIIMLTFLAMISPATALNAAVNVSCAQGKVIIPYMEEPFRLCFDKECRNITNQTTSLRYNLPISPLDKKVAVKLQPLNDHEKNEKVVLCDRPKFCDSHYLLSKTLLGNPHCWPEGGIVTTAIFAYVLAVILLIISCLVIKKGKKRSKSGTKEQQRSKRCLSKVEAPMFELTALPGSASLVACAILCAMIPTASTCQRGYMRQNVDLICNEQNQCHFEYSRELLFNKLQKELCIEIVHENKTIGTAKFLKKPVEFKCVKVTETYTRSTKTRVYHVERCALAGSCTANKCKTLHANETVKELKFTQKYPGYSGCISNCGGLVCGCLLPMPACSFYRVAHRPESTRVFEIIQCPHWVPTVSFDIEWVLLGRKKTFTVSMKPYVTENMEEFNITTISLQKPANALVNKRFAISNNVSLALPDHFVIPVECSSQKQAENNFATCVSRVRCNCEHSVRSCECPEASIRTLHGSEKAKMPLETPYGMIDYRGNDIMSISEEEEIILRIESKIVKESAVLVQHLNCDINVTRLSGCYNCPQGADFSLTCTSNSTGILTAICDSQEFSFSCETSGKNNWILLNFQKSLISERCSVPCGVNGKSFILEGNLHYHILAESSVFEHNTYTLPLSHQWFSDVNLPDIGPLIMIIRHHWKLTLAAIGSAVALAALSYLLGPLVIIFLLKAALNILSVVAGALKRILCNDRTHSTKILE